jgi:hypothetical protein
MQSRTSNAFYTTISLAHAIVRSDQEPLPTLCKYYELRSAKIVPLISSVVTFSPTKYRKTRMYHGMYHRRTSSTADFGLNLD